uniref:CPSF_A domain-containing protein n=1 Tax=Steinernema glaseri TaxID=37863 RepID=A0A1I8A3N1_9BILA
MAYNYIASAQKPTVVTHSVVGKFRSEDNVELVVARINRLELLRADERGLKTLFEYSIYGRIVHLAKFRKQGEKLDSLIVLTLKLDLAILKFNEDGDLVPRCHGNLSDRIGRPAECGILLTVHPTRGILAIHQSDGMLRLVFWEEGETFRSYNVRISDLKIVDIQFIYDADEQDREGKYRLAMIYDENARHIRVVDIKFEQNDTILSDTWNLYDVDADILIPIPAPIGGFVFVGEDSITYHKNEHSCDGTLLPLIHGKFSCYDGLEGSPGQYLLGDMSGKLYMIAMHVDEENGRPAIQDITINPLGNIGQPECISYVDNGVIFIGSRFSDNELICIVPEKDSDGSHLRLVDSFPNLGPITDMQILHKDNEINLITCSGAFQDGSLRVVRNGIGVDKIVTIDIERVVGIFPLALGANSKLHTHLVLAHFHETRFLAVEGQEFEDVTERMSLYIAEQQTIWMGVMPGNFVVQVTDRQIRSIKNEEIINEVFENPISCVSVNDSFGQLMVASANKIFYYQYTESGEIRKIFEQQMDNEVACIDISPFEENETSKIFCIGFWTIKQVRLYTLNAEPAEITRVSLGDRDILRSILMVKMEHTAYVIASLADGSIQYLIADFENSSLTDHKRATLGRLPIKLVKFYSKGHATVFACGDRPTLLFSSKRKLVLSSVNLKLVETMCSFNAEEFRDTSIFISHTDMIIGTVDEIQKLHIRKINAGETVRRIVVQEENRTSAILTMRTERRVLTERLECSPSFSNTCKKVEHSVIPDHGIGQDITLGMMVNIHSICILDESYQPFYVHELGPCEHAMSLHSMKLGMSEKPYYVLGTALAHPDETECRGGRIMMFEVVSTTKRGKTTKRAKLVCQKVLKGAVYSISDLLYEDKMVASVNSAIRLFELNKDKTLTQACEPFVNFMTCIAVKTQDHFIIGGDIMRSITVLRFLPEREELVEVARDFETNWMTALEFIDERTFIGAENNYNLFVLHHDLTGKTEEEQHRLKTVGQRGILLNAPLDSSVKVSNPVVAGTVDGSIYIIAQLEENIFEYLRALQTKFSKQALNCMRISHAKYREFHTETRKLICKENCGFIDGDLLEGILDMPTEDIATLMKGVYIKGPNSTIADTELSVEELTKIIEDLSRIH